ncbi:lipopolysaccharide biosynthesis protein [Aeromonas hydrophila]|uniref:lipopolysaccharide biosynthesis protein n=1 Tax=Aeromonas hydrophila TaxID=644 RepID=UPI001B3A2814|nr:lipopolysaccharide biosynthesis protein [Aeromonas hydrophila]MBQ4677643.1 oligosaccharide flippase family protein [Aeromonas hydrophila]MBW3816247.1 oligosaccharide flippase family protein [Aeromonas hydrophila]MCF7676594.1 lipopolysaccharide biosynthesis protein [Aeromonas hydrophila]MCF7773326.1 lipopolysaccharide biosynthesis protein [Aeromonas hydrophila]
MSLRKRALSGLIWNASDKLITQFGYFAVTLYIAKLIGPEAFGLIGMLTIFMLLTESVISNGFSQALVQRSQQLTEADASTVFYINIVWGVFIYAVLFVTAPLIAQFYQKPELVDIARWLFLIVIINSLTVVVRAKLTIKVEFKSQAISGLFATFMSAPIAIYLAQQDYSYWSFVWLLLIKAVVLNISLWCFSRWYPQPIFSKDSFYRLFKFGSNLMLAGFVATLVNNLYVALIGRYFSATSVGYFTQATNVTNFLSQFISSTLQGVTYPILTSVKEDRERLINIYKQLINATMLVSLPALVGFCAVAEEFVLLFLGEPWLPTVPVIQLLCIARMVTPISTINMSILNAIGRSDLFLKIDLSKLPMMLSALFITIPYGIEGIAWGMVVTSLISFFINAYYPGKLFGFGAISQLNGNIKIIIATALMYGSIVSLSSDSIIFSIFLKFAIGFFVYIFSLLLLKQEMTAYFFRAVTCFLNKKYFN